MRKICAVCKRDFIATHGKKTVCSNSCRREYISDYARNYYKIKVVNTKKEITKKVCEHCKLEFSSNYVGRFCSPDCGKQAKTLDQNKKWCTRKERKVNKEFVKDFSLKGQPKWSIREKDWVNSKGKVVSFEDLPKP